MWILKQSQQEVRLVEIKNCLINFRGRIFVNQIQLGPITHQQSLELRRCILAQAARAETDAAAELANPGTRISTRPKVLIVAHFQTHVAKLAGTSILGLLRKLQVAFQIGMGRAVWINFKQFCGQIYQRLLQG